MKVTGVDGMVVQVAWVVVWSSVGPRSSATGQTLNGQKPVVFNLPCLNSAKQPTQYRYQEVRGLRYLCHWHNFYRIKSTEPSCLKNKSGKRDIRQ